MENQKDRRLRFLSGALVFALVLSGCKNNGTEPQVEPVLEEDAAYAVAGALSEGGGGAAEQMGDAVSLAGSGGLQAEPSYLDGQFRVMGNATIDTSYDAVTGWWTATVVRSKTSLDGNYVAQISRVYQYQFLNSSGVPQRRYIVGSDTAYSIHFIIVSGTGYHRTPFRVHRLDSLHGDWMVTNTHTAVVTINGSYYRAGSDTLTTRETVRTHNNTLTMTFTDVRKARPAAGGGISGTISGNYTATITFTGPELYRERSVNKDFTIVLDGDNADIHVGDRMFPFGWRLGAHR
ncbi:MAG: hypothetical protein A3H45_01845 [Ignavibacteria bacterium RIFCSPLOWO2_02_FULL_55_14]|nr:MAG: hypothetical protein A3H45_01845 [Ignavibacteria bacterium RIFCSPLOWO2_02_FULL_55_14]